MDYVNLPKFFFSGISHLFSSWKSWVEVFMRLYPRLMVSFPLPLRVISLRIPIATRGSPVYPSAGVARDSLSLSTSTPFRIPNETFRCEGGLPLSPTNTHTNTPSPNRLPSLRQRELACNFFWRIVQISHGPTFFIVLLFSSPRPPPLVCGEV